MATETKRDKINRQTTGVGKHHIDPVGRPTGSLSASFQKILPAFVGRLGSGSCLVADRADVVFIYTHKLRVLTYSILGILAERNGEELPQL